VYSHFNINVLKAMVLVPFLGRLVHSGLLTVVILSMEYVVMGTGFRMGPWGSIDHEILIPEFNDL